MWWQVEDKGLPIVGVPESQRSFSSGWYLLDPLGHPPETCLSVGHEHEVASSVQALIVPRDD